MHFDHLLTSIFACILFFSCTVPEKEIIRAEKFSYTIENEPENDRRLTHVRIIGLDTQVLQYEALLLYKWEYDIGRGTYFRVCELYMDSRHDKSDYRLRFHTWASPLKNRTYSLASMPKNMNTEEVFIEFCKLDSDGNTINWVCSEENPSTNKFKYEDFNSKYYLMTLDFPVKDENGQPAGNLKGRFLIKK